MMLTVKENYTQVVMIISLLIATSLFQVATCLTYYVKPDADNYSTNNNTHLLEYYLNNINEYLTSISHSVFYFLPRHYLQNDLLIQNVTNISIIGNNSSITCSGSRNGVIIENVICFTLQNITLIQCGKNSSHPMINSFLPYDHNNRPSLHWNSALFLHNCAKIICNVLITVTAGTNGLLVVNVAEQSTITNLTIHVKCLQSIIPTTTSGMMVHYFDWNTTAENCSLNINSYIYRSDIHCSSFTSQYTIVSLLVQSMYNVSMMVTNSDFTALSNTIALYYYGESYGTGTKSVFILHGCQFINNVGNSITNIILAVIHNSRFVINSQETHDHCDSHNNIMELSKSLLYNNINASTIIYIIPINTIPRNVHILIENCSFNNNYASQLIKIDTEVKLLWQMSYSIILNNVHMSANKHLDGISLISITNGLMKWEGTIFISNNSYHNLTHIPTEFAGTWIF